MSRQWTNDEVKLLREHWREPLSVLVTLLGRTKDSIVGQGSRLGLPRRRQQVSNKELFRVVLPVPSHPFSWLREHDCRFPIGDPGDPGFRFCGAPALDARPYCEEHCQVAYRVLVTFPVVVPQQRRRIAG